LYPLPLVRYYFRKQEQGTYRPNNLLSNILTVQTNNYNINSENRYYQITKSISFEEKKLRKFFNFQVKKYWEPSSVFAVDELLLKFCGRCSFRQHIRGKPNDTGLKFFGLADQNGFLYHQFLYRGKEQQIASELFEETEYYKYQFNNYQSYNFLGN